MWRVPVSVTYFLGIWFSQVVGEEHCDKLGILLYEDIGCKPVIPKGSKCPIKFECDDFSSNSKNCLLRGKTFTAQEQVNNSITYPSCKVGCICNEQGGFTCAILDCPEWLGNQVPAGCYRKYEADKCCSVGQLCPSEASNYTEATCLVEGQTVREGERFYPKNTCVRCVCPQNFTGKLEEPYCQRISCNVQIRDSENLEKSCAPFYFKSSDETDATLCCPSDWICPSEEDEITKINPEVKENPDLLCIFGNRTVKFGEGLEKEFEFYGSPKKAKCECILPPFLTCKEV